MPKNNLPTFDRHVTEAWHAFQEVMESRGWYLAVRDNSNVHLERHERGENKGFMQSAFKQFWVWGGEGGDAPTLSCGAVLYFWVYDRRGVHCAWVDDAEEG